MQGKKYIVSYTGFRLLSFQPDAKKKKCLPVMVSCKLITRVTYGQPLTRGALATGSY